MMRPDDELCLCFHVTRRKVEQYLRTRRPAVASQLSECYGAGTGCGWCRPFLERLHQQVLGGGGISPGKAGDRDADGTRDELFESADFPDADRYVQARAAYRESLRPSPTKQASNPQASESGEDSAELPESP